MALPLRRPPPRRWLDVVPCTPRPATRCLASSARAQLTNTDQRDREHSSLVRKYTASDRTRQAKARSPKNVAIHQYRSQSKPQSRPRAQATPKINRTHPPMVRPNAKVEVLGLDGQPSFSAVFLRDLCSCPLCVDTSTRQKLFVTADIPRDIAAAKVALHEESLKIWWRNDVPGYEADHVTEIPFATLAQYAAKGDCLPPQDLPSRVMWDAQMYQQQTQDFTYEEYMEDDAVLLKALRQLQSHGLLFVTNVPSDEKSVKRLSKRIGPLKNTFYGKTWDVRSVPEAKNVAYTSQNLGFHMDLMYMKQPPHLQLLHCIRSSSAGGASLFADSFKAAIDLCDSDLDSFNCLSRVKVDYHYAHEAHHYLQSRPVIEQQPICRHGFTWYDYGRQGFSRGVDAPTSSLVPAIDFIDAVSWSPPFQAPFRVDAGLDEANTGNGDELISRKIDQWHSAASKFNELVHRPEAIYERLMKAGECVVFDNRRVLHARKAFEVGDMGKERWLRGAYIDKDPFMSKLKILTDRYGRAGEIAKQQLDLNEAYFEDGKDAVTAA